MTPEPTVAMVALERGDIAASIATARRPPDARRTTEAGSAGADAKW
jgi:hypothetical protein